MSDLSNDQNEINIALKKLTGFRWKGLNNTDLIGAVAKSVVNPDSAALLGKTTNRAQIMFAKHVWNNGNVATRGILLESTADWFIELAKNPSMTPLLVATLDRHTANIRGGNRDGKAAYEEIAAKVIIARQKIERSQSRSICRSSNQRRN